MVEVTQRLRPAIHLHPKGVSVIFPNVALLHVGQVLTYLYSFLKKCSFLRVLEDRVSACLMLFFPDPTQSHHTFLFKALSLILRFVGIKSANLIDWLWWPFSSSPFQLARPPFIVTKCEITLFPACCCFHFCVSLPLVIFEM